MVSQEWKKRWAAFRFFVRDWTHVFSGIGLGVGLLLLVIGTVALLAPTLLPSGFMASLTEESGRLDICSAGFGLLITIFAGYYFLDNINNRRKFNKLFNTASKEKFIKNRDELEELAFYLSTKHERMVQKKVKEMKLR
jgi:hypothetical protein